MEGRYNIRSPAVKRLMKEAQELSEPTDQYFAQPLEDNLFEWHFTVRGPLDSDFQNGIYHGRIILPMDYPMKPPSIIWLTPNGRFETNKKICLSISGHHPESWQPSWSIRTALLAIIGFMPTHPGGAIGSLDYKPEERKALAKKSRSWKCPVCDDISGVLLEVTPESQSANKEAQELAAQIRFQGEKPKDQGKKPEGKTDEHAPKVEEKKKEPLSENGEKAAAPTSPEMSPEAHLSTDVAKTITDIQKMSSYSPVTTSAASINDSSSQPNPITPTAAPPVFSAPPCSASGPSPWCSTPPFLPQNFYSRMNTFSHASPAMPPHFPYPPSFYSTASSFYPPGCALPPGVGMFPCPFPPPPPPQALASNASSVISVNNSSAQVSAPRLRAQSSVNYSRSPMTCPSASVGPQVQQAEASEAISVANSDPLEQTENLTERQDRSQVLDELLAKVKRVGSEENFSEAQLSKEKKQEGKKPCHVELVENQGDSDVSTCLKKNISGGEASTSDIVPSDAENSEADVPPLEVSESEPRSVLEKSTCSSTPELEKWKLKRLQPKGLRQRQSATASINTEVSEDVSPSQDSSGQRIEAESGDSGPRNRLQPGDQGSRIGQVNTDRNGRMPVAGLRRNSFDFTFFLMVVLFIGTLGIFLNRLLRIYWAEDLDLPRKPV